MNAPGAPAGAQADAEPATYIHATALVIGEAGILIRGPSGCGKSRLALDLITEAKRRGLFARLVGDDRIAIAARGGRLVARPHPAISGQIESRGEGILDLGCEYAAVIRLVVEMAGEAPTAPVRLPEAPARASLCAVELPLLRLAGQGPHPAGLLLDRLLRIGNG
jgi:serine kinase of HPr protein (carbohydrate metabolism regulator)